MNCEYLLADCTDPYRNLAVEQCLMKQVKRQTYILFLWQNDHTIVVGRNQNPYRECKVQQFLKTGGKIARRRSGGGAVYHDLGNLNFSILCYEKDAEECAYPRIVGEALQQFGITVEFNGKNDLLYQGRKISGNAAYTENGILCRHGTILIDTDIGKMTDYLTPEQGKLDRNHVGSVASRVMNLGSISEDITIAALKTALIEVTCGSPSIVEPNGQEIEALAGFYGDKDWIYGGNR